VLVSAARQRRRDQYSRAAGGEQEVYRKGAKPMSDKQKNLLALIEKLLPSMSEMEQEKLLAFGEGMAFMTRERERLEQVRPGA